jgi:hypothetical protein
MYQMHTIILILINLAVVTSQEIQCTCNEICDTVNGTHYLFGILLILVGLASTGYILFTALSSEMVEILLPFTFTRALCITVSHYGNCVYISTRVVTDAAYRQNKQFGILTSLAILMMNSFITLSGIMIIDCYFTAV